jgi:hypothetical protein
LSLQFIQPYMGLGNSLQTAQATGGAVGGWVELGRTTLGSSGDSIDVTSLDDKRYYWVLSDLQQVTGDIGAYLRNNGDTGNNYANRASANGGSDQTFTTTSPFAYLGASGSTGYGHNLFMSTYVSNLATKEKLYLSNYVGRNTAGAGTAPSRGECTIKHAQTTNPISQFNMDNVSAGSYNTGSEMVVLGWDPADTHTTNFWEELASGDVSSVTNASTGTISAKKYLWIQCWMSPSSSAKLAMQFNNDTGANYCRRLNTNNSESTGTSDTQANISATKSVPYFYNGFMVNNSANEKLLLGVATSQNTAGAGNAPDRQSNVNKWTNTSAQITEIDFFQHGGGTMNRCIFKVWGSD